MNPRIHGSGCMTLSLNPGSGLTAMPVDPRDIWGGFYLWVSSMETPNPNDRLTAMPVDPRDLRAPFQIVSVCKAVRNFSDERFNRGVYL